MDMFTAVRFVDAFQDDNPKTMDSCPGRVNNRDLIAIAVQYNRRFRFFKRKKNIIYREGATRNIWYKRSKCNAGVVIMGFSLSRLKNHPNAIPMQRYAEFFLDDRNPEWLERNDYKLI